MKLFDLGEYGLVDRIRRHLKEVHSKRFFKHRNKLDVAIGPGDDSAVVQVSKDIALVISTDTLVENTHFNLSWAEFIGQKKYFYLLGYKSIAVNLSDLSAMGAVKPLFCLVSLGLPGDISVKDIDSLYTGMRSLTDKYNTEIIGGDTFRSKDIIISITIIGKSKSEKLVKRSGARILDYVYVTGTLGDSMAGLEVLQQRSKKSEVRSQKIDKNEKYLIRRQLCPQVRLKEAEVISSYAGGMIDCSDGLYWSVKTISQESKAGMKIYIDNLPASEQLKSWAKSNKKSLSKYTVLGGEEYELVFTSGVKNLDKILKRMNIHKIGEVLPAGRGLEFYFNNKKINIDIKKGFEHFR